MIEKYKFAEVPEDMLGYKAIVVKADYYVFTRPNEKRILNTNIKKRFGDIPFFVYSIDEKGQTFSYSNTKDEDFNKLDLGILSFSELSS